MTEFTTRNIKGGALLAESRRLVDVWNDGESTQNNLERIRSHNLLGLPSRARAADTLEILRQRFIDPQPSILPSLRLTARDSAVFRNACYYEASRNDDLLAFSTESVLFDWWELGRNAVPTDRFERALMESAPTSRLKNWNEQTRRRVVHGLLSALRDFGILDGKNNKSIAPPGLSLGGFAYVVGRMRQQDAGDVPTSPVWRRWLLDDNRVRALFLEADRLGLLRYAEAGSVTRIDWIFDDLEEVVSAAV